VCSTSGSVVGEGYVEQQGVVDDRVVQVGAVLVRLQVRRGRQNKDTEQERYQSNKRHNNMYSAGVSTF